MLHEKYRPKDWDEVVAQDKIVERLKRAEKAGKIAGKSWWISVKSGQGKTTIAKIIAKKLSNLTYTREYDAQELSKDELRVIMDELPYRPLDCAARAYIVNEAHGLRTDTARMLLKILEDTKDHVVWIFTTTVEGEVKFGRDMNAKAFLSRCMRLDLAKSGISKPAAKRLKFIAECEGAKVRPLKYYQDLFLDDEIGSNFRAAINRIEAELVDGTL